MILIKLLGFRRLLQCNCRGNGEKPTSPFQRARLCLRSGIFGVTQHALYHGSVCDYVALHVSFLFHAVA